MRVAPACSRQVKAGLIVVGGGCGGGGAGDAAREGGSAHEKERRGGGSAIVRPARPASRQGDRSRGAARAAVSA